MLHGSACEPPGIVSAREHGAISHDDLMAELGLWARAPSSSMPYSITYEPSAARALGKVHPAEQKRIARAIEALAVTPRPPGAVQLAGGEGEGELRIRVGDYCTVYDIIVYDIDDGAVVVLVLRIGHRSDVYR